jgi:predicted Fe-Mo cluster-binding NifX family protein
MKIAIPTAQGMLCMHFGHCEKFTILEVDENSKEITSQNELDPPPHEPGLLPRWLAEKNVDLVIAGGMGARAQALFQENGINIIVGAPSEAPEKVVKAHLDGTLTHGVNACDH